MLNKTLTVSVLPIHQIKHPYTVLFANPWTKTKRIGAVKVHHSDAESLWQQGKYLVCDVITNDPFEVLVPEAINVCAMGAFLGHVPLDLVIECAWRERAAAEAQKVHDALTEFGVGAKFSIGVFDGAAHYVVTHLNTKTCVIAWRGFGMDDYWDRHFGGGGTFPITEVARYCRFGKQELFGRRSDPSFPSWDKLKELKLISEGLE